MLFFFFFLAFLIEGDFVEKTTQAFGGASQKLGEIAQDVADVRFAHGCFLRRLAIPPELRRVSNFVDQFRHERRRIAQRLGEFGFVIADQFDKGANARGSPRAHFREKFLAPERAPKTAFVLHAPFQGALRPSPR